jgi:hypothetical protein
MVLWSGLWAVVAVSQIRDTFSGVACAQNQLGTAEHCQEWIGVFLAVVLLVELLVWLVGMGVLVLVRTIGRSRGHGGAGREYCRACGAKVDRETETCPRCGTRRS